MDQECCREYCDKDVNGLKSEHGEGTGSDVNLWGKRARVGFRGQEEKGTRERPQIKVDEGQTEFRWA